MTDLVKTTFTGGPAGDWLNQFRIDRLLGGTAQDSIDIVQSFWDYMKTSMSSVLSFEVHGDVEILDPITGGPTGIDQATARTGVCSDVGDPLPWQTQARIIWNTGVWVNNRQVRGSTFVPGLTENSNTNQGVPSSTFLGYLATAGLLISNATTATPGVYSRKHHNTYPIVSQTIPARWSVLRTRR